MNIEQTCKIILTAEEVREALTTYIRENNRYRTNFRTYDECIEFRVNPTVNQRMPEIVVLWGEAPEEEPVVSDPTPTVAGTGTPIPPIDVAAALQTA